MKRFGEHADKEYDDWEGVEELTNLPDEAFHRDVDKIVLQSSAKHADSVKTAILCPPTIFGTPTIYPSIIRPQKLTFKHRARQGPSGRAQQTSLRAY